MGESHLFQVVNRPPGRFIRGRFWQHLPLCLKTHPSNPPSSPCNLPSICQSALPQSFCSTPSTQFHPAEQPPQAPALDVHIAQRGPSAEAWGKAERIPQMAVQATRWLHRQGVNEFGCWCRDFEERI